MHGVPHMPAQNAGIYGARMILFRPRLRKIKADRWATRPGNQPAELYEKTDKDGNLEKHGKERTRRNATLSAGICLLVGHGRFELFIFLKN